mmetsp:Transcript_62783/g.149811  ORF Transcript_62783/g.149811 Transcript_62783/m.149811 type:complete len:326 (-) Transcript_62783:76-1053(-)
MGDLFFVEGQTQAVWTFSPAGDGSWRFSRMAPCQYSKHVLILSYVGSSTDPSRSEGWAVRDYSPNAGQKGAIIGLPHPLDRDAELPPCGAWLVWGRRFWLQDEVALVQLAQPKLTFPIDTPFATVAYHEERNIAYLDIKMKAVQIKDEPLEELFGHLREALVHLARRPSMVLFLKADAQDALLPCMRHIRRFLSFVQENGPEYFLVVRGSAIVIYPKSILGQGLMRTIRMVQGVFPSPWPERILPTMEEAESWLAELAAGYREPTESKPVRRRSYTLSSNDEDHEDLSSGDSLVSAPSAASGSSATGVLLEKTSPMRLPSTRLSL